MYDFKEDEIKQRVLGYVIAKRGMYKELYLYMSKSSP